MESRINDLQMDMTGVEMLVANAHHQVQHVEDEILAPFMAGQYAAQQHHCILEEALRDRADNLKLVRDRVEEKCLSVQDVLMSWMVTFEALETNIGFTSGRVQMLEDNQE